MPSNILKDIPLGPLTTLGVGGSAEYFTKVHDVETLRETIAWAKSEKLSIAILGAGSNVLVSDEGVRGLVIQPQFTDITYKEEGGEMLVTVGAGIILDRLIEELVQNGYWGLENLSAIPGTVGAVPVQNVGAYGVEVKDVIQTVTVFDIQSEEERSLTSTECAFGYRDSIFKHEKNRYIILEVTFRVSKNEKPVLLYKDLQNYFEACPQPALQSIRNAIIEIRSKKFPNWKIVGTAGSFFKNPSISKEKFEILQKQFPELPGHVNSDGGVKISLGWVLDRLCSLRGYTEGNVGLYTEQALVLVCSRNATSDEIEKFSEKIIRMVFEKIKVVIEREVTILT